MAISTMAYLHCAPDARHAVVLGKPESVKPEPLGVSCQIERVGNEAAALRPFEMARGQYGQMDHGWARTDT